MVFIYRLNQLFKKFIFFETLLITYSYYSYIRVNNNKSKKNMLLRQLEYILAVERYQSFTKAADACCVTQPTLSQQIRTLEDYLGVEVFDRTTLPIEPTRKGKMILDRAVAIVQQAHELEKFAKELRREPVLV
jgi:LysR family hydrogen peroxide-inducible transcriptional activator